MSLSVPTAKLAIITGTALYN